MMPMSSKEWYEEMPEFITEAEYRALSEDISRTIEVVYGQIIKCESPTRRHQRIAFRLAEALTSAIPSYGPCLSVDIDVDVILWRVPRFTFRRPDVVVYQCIDDPVRTLTAQEAVMVVEVTSPTTVQQDLVDKKAQYSAAGIRLYLVIVLDEDYEIAEIREFHLDAAASAYRLYAVHRSVLDLEEPFRLKLPIADLII
jgi:Uma2 family endonuclease